MIRPIIHLGDPVLKHHALPIEPAEIAGETVQSLVRDMFETLNHAGGVGLAAPQVGESLRVILAGSFPTEANPDRPRVAMIALVNPRIVQASTETELAWESCLSIPRLRVRVRRALAVEVEYRTLDGKSSQLEAQGFYARVLQHEIDHLDGILTVDRAEASEDVRPVEDEPS
jgi:peptide deformylase